MSSKQRTVGIVGAPFWFGQPKSGVEDGPNAIRDSGLVKALEDLKWTPVDYGDVDIVKPDQSLYDKDDSTKAKNLDIVAWGNKIIHDAVYKAAKENDFVLTLGGDHSIAIGSISALMKAHKDLCVLWIDAHADINTPDGSLSGNMHGMPVSYLLGIESHEKFSFIEPFPCNRISYIGLRDVDDEEKKILKKYNVKAFSMKEVDKWGIGKVVEMALDHINPERDRPIHLSFDIDGIDSSIVPSTGTPVEGGLTFREGRYICEALNETGKLVSMDLVEVNPNLSDEKGKESTLHTAIEILKSAFGKRLI